MKKTLAILILSAAGLLCCNAEVRIWRDRNGNQYEAEFVRELFGKMTLRCTDGTEVRISIEEFSDHDQKYLRVMVPPEMSITFQEKEWVKPKPYEVWETTDKQMMVQGHVSITKITPRPFTGRLNAELFMIAAEVDGDNFVLLSRTESSFLLGEHNNNTHTFSSEPDYTRQYDEMGPSGWRGEIYEGYLIVISDSSGKTVTTQTNIHGNWIDKPEVIENLRDLMLRGAGSIRSRHFDKTGRKSKLTRPMPRQWGDVNH